jgi:hypothetical protein
MNISQEARDAAADQLENLDQWLAAARIRFGSYDNHPLVQAIQRAIDAARAQLAESLLDPATVHVNTLAGRIAKLPPAQIWHIYGRELLTDMPDDIAAAIREQDQ